MALPTSRHTRLRITLLALLISAFIAVPVFSQSTPPKPLGLNQIELLIRNRTPDSVVAAEILARGIDFVVTEEFLRQISLQKNYPQTTAILKDKLKPPPAPVADSEPVSRTVKILIADFYNTSGEDRAIRQNIVDKLTQLVTKTDAEIIIPRLKVETSGEARKLGEKEKADIVLWGWYATSSTTAQISANFEFTSKVPFISSLKPPGPKQIPINEMDNFSFQVKMGEEYSALVLLTLGLISEQRDDFAQAVEYYTQALNLKGLSEGMSFHLWRQRGAVRFDLASLRGIIRETESLSDLKAALSIRPDDFITFYVLGLINYARGNTDEGIGNFNLALSRADDTELKLQILLKLFWSYFIKGDEANQKQTLESILSESANLKDLAERHLYLGMGNLLKKNYIESRARFEEASKFAADKEIKAVAYLYIGATFGIESEIATDEEKEKALSAKAEDYLKLAIETAPDSPGFYQLLGGLKYSDEDYEKALENFSRAIALRPKFQQFYFDRAKTYEELKNYPAALKDLEKAVEIDPKSLFAHGAKAEFHKNRKEFLPALNELDICLSIEKRKEFYKYKAEIYEASKDYRNARKAALQAVKLSPEVAEEYFELAKRLEILETPKLSLETVKSLLASENSPYLMVEKSFLMINTLKKDSTYRETPVYQAAVDNFEQAFSHVKTDADYAAPLHLQNICFAIEKRYDAENDSKNGIAILSKCLEKLTELKIEEHQLAELYNDRAANYRNLNDPDAAIKDFSTAIKYDSKEAIYYRNRAVSYRDKKMFAEALNDLKIAISIEPTDVDFYQVRAFTYESMKDFENARKDYLRMISLAPGNYNTYTNYFLKTIDYRQKNSFPENLKLLDKLFEEFKSPYLIIEKGIVYYEASAEKSDSADKNYKNALAEFDRAFTVTLASPEFKNQNYIYGVCRKVTEEFMERGNYDNGVSYADKCIKELEDIKSISSLLADIYNQRAVLFYKSGNFDAAIVDFTKALEKQKTPTLLHNRADAYYIKKMFTEALDDINLAIKEYDNNANYYFMRSKIYRDKGDFVKAIADIKIAIEKESDADQKAEYQKHLDELHTKAKLPKNDKLP